MSSFQAIRHDCLLLLEQTRHALPASMTEIGVNARQRLRDAARISSQTMDQVAELARRQVSLARTGAEATMREIAGQGPGKTLGRGFAVVRNTEGEPLTDSQAAQAAGAVHIEFRDGHVAAHIEPGQIEKNP